MKTRLLTIAILLCTFAAKAQYVTIPDPAFVQFLQLNYPNCMNGNQMDTTCSEIVNETQIQCSHGGIADLAGVQYFDNLSGLDCNNNILTSLPNSLPLGLTGLICDDNNIVSLPTLPAGLDFLSCIRNSLSALPSLPDGLTYLDASENNIGALPTLPVALSTLQCNSCGLDSLPELPLQLNYLNCSNNLLTTLPTLPNNLTGLIVSDNSITSLPTTLPYRLKSLQCDNNLLSSIPALPDSLLSLNFSHNSMISNIPNLPSFLLNLGFDGTNVGTYPVLPASVTSISAFNLLQQPQLPQTLPPNLIRLNCGGNGYTSLPALPPSIRTLLCFDNNLTYIPNLPDTIDWLGCSNNPNLTCLPKINYAEKISIGNTAIGCLPNSFTWGQAYPPIDTLPICNQFNNPNGCQIYANISGRSYADRNSNCAFDSTDEGQFGLKHSIYSNGVLLEQTYSNNVGNYSFDETGLGNYETRLDTTGLPLTIACPTGGVYYDTLTANDSLHFNRDFALQCETGFDLAAYSVASNMIFRPANNTTVDIHAGDLANFYRASCAQGVSGTVTVKLHGPISYIAPANGAVAPSNVSNNILTWNVADFGTADALNDFNITIQTDTFAQSGQQACFEVNVTPLAGDNDTSNNHIYYCFNIVNSYDPNDKTAYPSGNIDTTQEWLTYTVRFQNTGSAEAQHIYIMDTLDADVDAASFQLLSYSHQPNVQIKENIVRFNFPFINLPDSNTNEPGSHGYVQYKVKLKEDLPVGTAINNTAYIYFDFNPPVVTNTATNTIAVEEDSVEVGIKGIQRDMGITLYPNPANSQVTVSGNAPLYSITIYDIVGRIRLAQNVSGTSATIDISNLPSGLYVVGTGSSNKRLRLMKQ